MQYSPIPELRFGLSWQNGVTVTHDAVQGELGGSPLDYALTEWPLPSRLTVGARFDLDRYGLALEYRLVDYAGLDLTYRGFAEVDDVVQRETVPLGAVHSGHLGAELRLSRAELEFPLRAGVAIESIFGSALGASPFEPPPSVLTSLTLGAGVASRNWGGNLAIGTRLGRGNVGDGGSACDLCGQAGETALYEWSIALDFVARLGR